MGSIFQRYRQVILLAVLLIYTLAQILSAGAQKKRDLNWAERTVVWITAPPQKFCTFLIDRFTHMRLGYLYLVDTRKNYLELIQRQRGLVLKNIELEEEHRENLRLRSLLGFKEKTPLKMLAARVTSLSTSSFNHTARIDKGEADGLRPAMSVVNADGIVGHILNTTAHYANVLLLPDPNSRIDALDVETRARGILQGQGNDLLRLEFVDRNDSLVQGNLLVSAGLGAIYPKGFPVGTVLESRKDPASIFLIALVKPAVNFSRLEEVLVITSPLEESQEKNEEKKP